jgi:lipopolysaccharide biosynthesis protein
VSNAYAERYYRYVEQVLAPTRNVDRISLDFVQKMSETPNFRSAPISLVAFYQSQFHPIPENNRWRGVGFTDWTNVTRAVPQYVGHYQPRLPGELGFYDLRLIEIMRQQVDLARIYGIGGFCFNYYWFGGRRLLERPLDQYLAATDIDFPFCLCWVNENVVRQWDNLSGDVLMAQRHSPESDAAFIEDVLPALRDPRYLRFEGRPMLLVQRASALSDPKAVARTWRTRCQGAGVGDPYLVAVRSADTCDPQSQGFDAALELPPRQMPATSRSDAMEIVNSGFRGNIYSYDELAAAFAAQRIGDYPLIKTVVPGWDDEPRKPGAGAVFHGASPGGYARWLRQACSETLTKRATDARQPPFVFINAWNDWADGAYLEPDRKYGYAYLHATANILRDFLTLEPEAQAIVTRSEERFVKRSDTAVVVHLHYDDLLEDMAPFIRNAGDADIFISLRSDVTAQHCETVARLFPQARLAVFPNRGRDIQPFMQTLKLLSAHGYELVCKVHSKKSLHRPDGQAMRTNAMRDLLGSPEAVERVVERFRGDKTLGLLAPKGSLLNLGLPAHHVLNRRWLTRLFQELELQHLLPDFRCRFVAGSMFWFRLDAVKAINCLALRADDFEDELGQLDGTLAHGIERIFVAVAERQQFRAEEL